jgi:CheY-like chemotaxis protein
MPGVQADPSQLRLAVLNLVQNAVEASAERGGRVVVSTCARCVDAAEARSFHGTHPPTPGLYHVLEVRDEGSGIRPELLPHVFQPFVSSKFRGKGLGLAAVFGIARALGGAVRAESGTGGTRVQVLLPSGGRSAAGTEQPLRAADKILILDADPLRRELTRLTLESAGFEVSHADSEELALAQLQAHGAQARLLLVDEPLFQRAYRLRSALDQRLQIAVVLLAEARGATRGLAADDPGESRAASLGLPGLTVRSRMVSPWRTSDLLSQVGDTLAEQRSLASAARRLATPARGLALGRPRASAM